MRFSLSWLRELAPLPGREPRAIADALTRRGLTVDTLQAHGEDWVLDVDVPANRPDCLGHLGLARELAAAFDVPLVARARGPWPADPPPAGLLSVTIDEPELCSRYAAAIVREVRVGPSPDRVVRRLEACGMRTVNTVVDASNLVLLELGHPIHFFDLERLASGRSSTAIVIRRARDGETLTTLDGVARVLDREALVVATDADAVALAGVIGGAATEIAPTTRHVLIEAASFTARSIRATARRMGITTEASYRFARGVDPDGVLPAQDLALRLLHELAGGRAPHALLDVEPRPRAPRRLALRRAALRRLLGFAPDLDQVLRALDALGLAPAAADEQRIVVTLPSWRVDLEHEADLVEEVARHCGYDAIPSTPPPQSRMRPPAIEESARDLLVGSGFNESIALAMIGPDEDAPFVEPHEPVAPKLANAIAEPLSQLRRSMLPALVRAADLNVRRGIEDVRLFEVGHTFHARGPGQPPDESSRLGLVWCGAPEPPHWSGPARRVDFFDLAGLVDRLLLGLAPAAAARREPSTLSGLRPGRSLVWVDGAGARLAWGGELHPAHTPTAGLVLLAAEIDLDRLARHPRRLGAHAGVPRVPAVSRDLALVMRAGVTFDRVRDVLASLAAPAPAAFAVVDRYVGPPLGPGESSLTVRVLLQPQDRTLTEPEIESYRGGLVRVLAAELGIELRS